jgi:hypothetical protein
MHPRADIRRTALALLIGLALPGSAAAGLSLKEAVDAAGPAHGYDKYVVLETGVTYTGGLLIGPVLSGISYLLEGDPGLDVCIVGNGAILDLQGQLLCISYCNNRLDLEDCVVIRGGIRFRGMNDATHPVQPIGSIRYVTFYGPHEYGLRLQGAGEGITLERNIIVDAADTGDDYIYTNGIASDWLPTGTNISFSVQSGFYGTPVVQHNWSYHNNPETNADEIAHVSLLCEYG